MEIELKTDNEIAELFENLEEWTYQELKQNIQKHGIRDPLVVAEDGTIVCGHQRYRIALELGIKPPFRVMRFENKAEMVAFAVNDNLLRRQLNNYQKALLAMKLFEFETKEAEKRKGQRTDLMEETSVKDFTKATGRADEKASEKVGISHVTLRKVMWIEKNASDDLKLQGRKGEISISKAYVDSRKSAPTPKPKSFKPSKLVEERLLYPIEFDDKFVIATSIPKAWKDGVKVVIEPLSKERAIWRAKQEYSEDDTRRIIALIEQEIIKDEEQIQKITEELNAYHVTPKTEKLLKTIKKAELAPNSVKITVSFNGVHVIARFSEKGKAKEASEKMLDANLPLKCKDKNEGKISKDGYTLTESYTTQSRFRKEKWLKAVKEFFATEYPELTIEMENP